MAVDYGIVVKGGSWYAYEGTKLGQGRESVRQMLKDNQELLEEIKIKTMSINQATNDPAEDGCGFKIGILSILLALIIGFIC